MSEKEAFLVVGPAWVGDMVMAHALIRTLKNRFPEAALDVLAPPWSVALTHRMPEVRKGIDSPFGHGQLDLPKRRALGRALRSEGYARAYVCQNSFKSALVPYWANIPQRIGWLGEMRIGLLNQARRLPKEQYPKMLQRLVALADLGAPPPDFHACPAPRLHVTAEQKTQIAATFNIDTRQPILALCPGAAFGSSKQWTAEGYAKVADHYAAQGWQVWILGSAKETAAAQTISRTARCPIIDFTGKSSLVQSIDLLSLVQLVVTNDSGLMHIAAALQRPLVAVYGSSDPHFTPPISAQAKIVRLGLPCSPCFKRECPLTHHHCMTQLSAQTVLQAMADLVQSEPAACVS